MVLKPSKHIYNDTGLTRHFTPATQEWVDGMYTYNKNTIKTIPVSHKTIMSILNSYFKFKFKSHKIKEISTRYKRLSVNKIFIGKGMLKHTNDNVFITFFVYNTEKFFLLKNLQLIHKSLFYPSKRIKKYINIGINGKEIITYNRPFTLNEYLSLPNHYEEWYFSYLLYFVNKLNQYYSNINIWYETLTSLKEKNLLNDNEKKNFFFKFVNLYTFSYPKYLFYMNKCYWKYTKNLYRNRLLLRLNKIKFNKMFLEKLRHIVYSIYNKNIIFNIINLKKMHLNSDIFTQTVSLKLKNRNNKLYRVLKSSLRKLKLRNISRIRRQKKNNTNKYIVNKIRNDNINSMFNINVKDPLNNLLLDYFPWSEKLRINKGKYSLNYRYISLEDYVLSNLKHRKMAGIKLEAKGRLTRRFTASRSVFKMKWKGGLRNVDSSFRGLSAVMLRGHVKSNIQYSLLNSKNRNGAFGVKGWVSNK